jgi:hypothetical protein
VEPVVLEAVEDEPPALVDAAVPVADPEEIADVGTLSGSKPQLGAPKMNPDDAPDVEQNLIPLGLPPFVPDRFPLRLEDENGLDAVGGAAAPAPALTCAELTWACAASAPARSKVARTKMRSMELSSARE